MSCICFVLPCWCYAFCCRGRAVTNVVRTCGPTPLLYKGNKICLTFVLSSHYNLSQRKMACAPSEDSDQPGYPPSLIRVFAVRMQKAWVLSYPLSAQRRLWSDWADAQADLSLRWAHMQFCRFCHGLAQSFVISCLLSCTPSPFWNVVFSKRKRR